MVPKTYHLEAYFQSTEQQKFTRSEIRRVQWMGDDMKYFSWRGIAAQQAKCGSVRYYEAETTVPGCHLQRRFLRTASGNICKI
jgi:hypothetical protein